jgi:hypothetical protein
MHAKKRLPSGKKPAAEKRRHTQFTSAKESLASAIQAKEEAEQSLIDECGRKFVGEHWKTRLFGKQMMEIWAKTARVLRNNVDGGSVRVVPARHDANCRLFEFELASGQSTLAIAGDVQEGQFFLYIDGDDEWDNVTAVDTFIRFVLRTSSTRVIQEVEVEDEAEEALLENFSALQRRVLKNEDLSLIALFLVEYIKFFNHYAPEVELIEWKGVMELILSKQRF